MVEFYRRNYRDGTNRAKWWDYNSDSVYFITICTQGRLRYFGEIKNGFMCLSESGSIAYQYWQEMPKHLSSVSVDDFIIMPDHLHGIIILEPIIENVFEKDHFMAKISPKKGSLASVIRSYKSAVTRTIHNFDPHFSWQRGYYEHIIMNENSLYKIRNYIQTNSLTWKKEFLSDLLKF